MNKGASQERPEQLSNVQLISRTRWVVTDLKSVWKTEDAGRSWKRTLGPVEEEKSGDFSGGLSFVNEQTGFVVLDHKVFGTVDGGNSWRVLSNANLGSSNIFFVDAMSGWAAGSEWIEDPLLSRKLLYVGKLWHTQDGGKTWHDQPLPKTYMDTHADRWDLKDVYFSDARNGWAVGDGVFLHTEDAGTTWKELNIRGDFSRVTFANQDLGWAIHREFGMFELTHDGGKSWKHIEMVVQTTEVRVLFVTPRDGFAIEGTVRFLASKDGGKTWESVTPDELLSPLENATDLGAYLGRAKDGTLVAFWLMGKSHDVLSIASRDGKSWE